MQAPRWVLIWRSQGGICFGCRCRPTGWLGFHLAYDRLVFNGLLFMCGSQIVFHLAGVRLAPTYGARLKNENRSY
jgi:hypothetical protein